jgi:hypothetical protein
LDYDVNSNVISNIISTISKLVNEFCLVKTWG